MEMNELTGRSGPCPCGRAHRAEIAQIVVGAGVLAQLPACCAAYSRIVLVADDNTWRAAGERAAALLAGKLAAKLIYSTAAGHVIPDEAGIAQLEAALTPDTDLIVGVGSGVINDLCKYVSFGRGIPYLIVATALSMDGYASSGAAMITAGLKVTYTTRPPHSIVADTEILRAAPREMMQAGYGDMIGKYSSLCDWRLGHVLNGEYFCPEVYGLALRAIDRVRTLADGLLRGEDEAYAALAEGLILSGMTLSFIDSTRPGSGSEHHFAHFFETTGLIHRAFSYSHGLNVGYAAVLTAELREKLAALEQPVFHPDDPAQRAADLHRIYGGYAAEVEALQARAGWYAGFDPTRLAARWQDIRAVLRTCPGREETLAMLRAVGLDYADFASAYGEKKICDARRYAKDLRDRYSILWLNYWINETR